jgi:hypothetical protein
MSDIIEFINECMCVCCESISKEIEDGVLIDKQPSKVSWYIGDQKII